MSSTVKTIFDFVVIGVLLKALVARLIVDVFFKWFKRTFLKSEMDVALWLHYRNKRWFKNHTDKRIKRL